MSRSALMACVLVVMAMSGLFASAQTAAAETRSLKIYFVHTGEKQDIIFKRNGRYDPKGLQALNTILRDWRRNEATKMDPRLFDLVWSVYKQSRSSGYIYVVSGYRSPATNAMLRSRSRGVAKESQHMHGTAMDFFIPGTPLKTLRDIGLKMQAGGVGYYPNSGSPFVHMDVAGVRSWPRLPRDELVRLFPDGKTLHIPADGRPLPGYQVAMEEYKRRLGSQQILMADSSSSSHRKSKNLFAMLFGGGDEDEGDEDVAPAKATAPPPVARQQQQELTNPSPVVVASAAPAPPMPDISAPVPLSRPTSTQGNDSLAVALYSPGGRNAAEDALQKVASNQPTSIPFGKAQPDAGDGYQDLSEYKIPVPTMLDTRGMKGDAENVMTASLAPGSLPPVEDGVMRIPVPAGRPALADAIAATMPQQDVASANAQHEPATVEEAMLSPAAAKALEMSEAASNKVATVTPLDRPSENTAAQVAAVPEPRPYIVAPAASTPKQELASLEPVSPSTKRRSGEFGDVFDQPKAAAQAIEASVPVKGARPGPSEAEVATRGMSGGKVLTRAMLSQWAMAKNHIEAPSAVSRGGRVVIDPPASASAQALPVGFSDKAPRIDPARFGAIR
nr:DUF882 domain-containing protein [Rhizobium oryziradicis]